MPSEPVEPDAGAAGSEGSADTPAPPVLPSEPPILDGMNGPPPLPPVLPPIPPLDRAPFEGRLHPMTLLFNAWSLVRGFIVPAIVLLFVGNKTFAGGFMLLFLMIPMVLAILRYFTFTYRIQGAELITAQGLLGRTERNIPLARVQDVRVEQGVLHRMLGMADVNIETAGGEGAEASLSVLSLGEAERLRAAVFEQASMARRTAGAAGTAIAPPAPVEKQMIRTMSLKDLVVAGLTSNQMASVLALLAIAFSVVDDVLPPETYQRMTSALGRLVEQFAQQGIAGHWAQIIAGVLALLLIGVVFSVVGSIVMFYGFTLSRSGEDLHRTYGLLTRRASSLPRRRIQLLKIEEKLLRRMFGLAALRADTAGSRPQRSQEGAGGRDVLLPAVPRAEIERMLPEFFPDIETGEAVWRRVSRRAIWRGTWKGGWACVFLAGILWSVNREWLNLWPLLLLPLVLVLNIMSYRHLGYSLGTDFFRTRRGWLSRATHILPIRNAQAIVLRQTPLDRRHRVASLIVDTAGQAYTGGAPRIDNVPLHEALTTARTLAHRASETRFRWHRG